MSLGVKIVDFCYVTIHVTFDVQGVITRSRILAVAQSTMEGAQTELAMAYAAKWLEVPVLNTCQKQAVRAFLDGKNVFVSLPTKSRKSLCFQSLPFAYVYLNNGPKSSIIEDRRIALVAEPTAAHPICCRCSYYHVKKSASDWCRTILCGGS